MVSITNRNVFNPGNIYRIYFSPVLKISPNELNTSGMLSSNYNITNNITSLYSIVKNIQLRTKMAIEIKSKNIQK